MASTHASSPRGSGLSVSALIIIIIVGILLVAGGLILGQFTPSLFPPQASAEARQVDGLFYILLVIGGAIFLLVQGLLVFSVWRFRAKPGDVTDGAAFHGNTALEITWTIIPAIIVLVLTILSWRVWNDLQTPRDQEMVVRAVGARFNWAFTYAEPLDILAYDVDVTTLPEDVQQDIAEDGMVDLSAPILYTFVGQPVKMEMQPRDVIHAFWIPAFRIKQDLIPGRTTTIRFTPTEPGVYPIRCAELCGANHGIMVGEVHVLEDQAAMDAMMAQMMEKEIFPDPDPAIRGRNILESNVYPCYTCHVLSDLASAGWAGNVGPALNGVADRAVTSRASATGLTPPEYLYQSVEEPTAYLVPGYGPLMPALQLPECDGWAIVAYLATQSDSGQAPFEVPIPDQCVVSGGPPGAQEASQGGETTVEPTATPGQ
jgi:cytochrome c oxidase subunit 2